MKNELLTVVIPVYNEEMNILVMYNRLVKACNSLDLPYEFIFINDGSRDISLHILKRLSSMDASVRYISFSRNFGHQVAVSAGIDNAHGDAVVIIDCDLQDPPELIHEMYKMYQQGYNVVYAKRLQRKGESLFKKMTAKLFYRFLSSVTSVQIPLDTGDFRLIDKNIVHLLQAMPEKHKFLRGQIAWFGYKQTFVMYNRDKRLHGKTGYTFRKMVKLAIDAVTSYSAFPLRIATYLGAAVLSVAFLLLLYVLYAGLIIQQPIPHFLSVILISLSIGGMQLFSIGIVGEYIGRMNTEIKHRPLYIIEESNLQSSSYALRAMGK